MSSVATLARCTEALIGRYGAAEFESELRLAKDAYSERRGRVFEDDEQWERVTNGFLEWYVVERPWRDTGVAPAHLAMADEPDAAAKLALRALATSQRCLAEVSAVKKGHMEVRDLVGGAEFSVHEERSLIGLNKGDIVEVRLIGFEGMVFLGNTFPLSPGRNRGCDPANHHFHACVILTASRYHRSHGASSFSLSKLSSCLARAHLREQRRARERMRALPLAAGVLGFAALLCASTVSQAQVAVNDRPAIGIERLWLEPGPGGILAATDSSVLAPESWHVAVLGTLMSRPIVLRPLQGGDETSVPVRLRLGYEVAVARGITRRLQLGAALPVVAAQDGDRLQGIDLSEKSLAPVALGDIRVHAKLRLQDDVRARLGYGLAMHLRLPTGDDDNFAGEAGAIVAWSLLADYAGPHWRVAANLGLRLRTTEVVLLSPARAHSNELLATIAGEYRHPTYPLGLLVEFSKVRGDGGGPSPGEARLGVAAYVLPRATLKVATSRGTTPGEVGSPAWRVLTVFEYQGR